MAGGGDVEMDMRGEKEEEEVGGGGMVVDDDEGLYGNGLLGMNGLLDLDAEPTNTSAALSSLNTHPFNSEPPSPPHSLHLPTRSLFQPLDDSALREAQALRMPSFEATTSTGGTIAFERQLRRSYDNHVVSSLELEISSECWLTGTRWSVRLIRDRESQAKAGKSSYLKRLSMCSVNKTMKMLQRSLFEGESHSLSS